jgi:hypothetical protein
MSRIIDLEEGRLRLLSKQGYRNWTAQFKEAFNLETRVSQISLQTLSCLARGKGEGTFYLYDLIMRIQDLGSGFEFDVLKPIRKIAVIDRYLFILDQLRFECMKRLGWIVDYPGEEYTLVEIVTRFDELAPGLKAKSPTLSRSHPDYEQYSAMNALGKETLIRNLIPKTLEEIQGHFENP